MPRKNPNGAAPRRTKPTETDDQRKLRELAGLVSNMSRALLALIEVVGPDKVQEVLDRQERAKLEEISQTARDALKRMLDEGRLRQQFDPERTIAVGGADPGLVVPASVVVIETSDARQVVVPFHFAAPDQLQLLLGKSVGDVVEQESTTGEKFYHTILGVYEVVEGAAAVIEASAN